MKLTLKATGIFIVLMGLASLTFAQVTEGPYEVKASIGVENTLSVNIVRVIGTTESTASSIDFGQLNLDITQGIYTADRFYIAYVGVTSNASSWTLSHAHSTCVNQSDATEDLDSNIKVTFADAWDTPTPGETIITGGERSFANSDVTIGGLPAGHYLKTYYGIVGTADPSIGVTPIPSTKAPGTYSGSVTFTLTPIP